MSEFSKLQSRHEDLIKTQATTDVLERVQNYIEEVKVSSSKVSSSEERDQLRANLRYWADYIYERTGIYPNIELAPSSGSRNRRNSFGVLFIVLILMAFTALGFTIIQEMKGSLTLTQVPAATLIEITTQPTPTPLPDCAFTTQLLAPLPLRHSSLVGTFTTPAQCTTDISVGKPFLVSGTASNIPEDVFLWLLVYARNAKYYPQCNDASNGLCGANYDGKVWGNTVYLGDPVGYPNCKERFYLILASVDMAGNDILISEMKKQSQSGYIGFAFSELPSSIKELARLEVETAGNTNSCP